MANGFDTADDAAAAALTAARPLSGKYEHAGAIYERDGRFYYTLPENSGKRERVNVTVRYPKGSRLAALYHTHPPDSAATRDLPADRFSPNDVSIARELDLPYYMGVVETGEMREFVPGKSEAPGSNRNIRQRIGSSRGEPVLAQIPIEQERERRMKELLGRDPDDPRGLLREQLDIAKRLNLPVYEGPQTDTRQQVEAANRRRRSRPARASDDSRSE